MILIPGYIIIEKISEGTHTALYRGYRESDEKRVVIKILVEEKPSPKDIARLENEYELLQHLYGDGAVDVYGLQKYQNGLALILEDFGTLTLKELLAQKRLSLDEFLSLAINITASLEKIHSHNVIHKNINPANILWNAADKLIKINNFDFATTLPREIAEIHDPELMGEDVFYISPEQTGRVNRGIDYRIDYYSLGVTFYQMAAGCLPFISEDINELVHSHIAKLPQPPHEINPGVPPVVSAIIMKLMAKTAEDRYQSTFGLKCDLINCMKKLKQTGRVENFTIGSQDISSRFQIPEKLYGREEELKSLLGAFDRVRENDVELMLVTGQAGVGKSALVHEFYKSLPEKKGYRISGKFDQLKRNVLYAPLIQAFQEMIKKILRENETEINEWRERIQQALGANGQVIVDVIPMLKDIIGEQPPVPALDFTEVKHRFKLVFQDFIHSLGRPHQPLVIFLDDCQWADVPTLELMEALLLNPENRHFLIIAAYRENEVDKDHALIKSLDKLRKAKKPVNTIHLSPLQLDQVKDLLSETLHQDQDFVQSIAEICYKKTKGNPFFLNQLLQSLYRERLIELDAYEGKWHWSIEKINKIEITTNVVDLLIRKINKLSASAKIILELAACLGNRFNLETLSIVSELPPRQVNTALREVAKKGLIVSINDNEGGNFYYQFLHDRVQQAVYSLLDESDRKYLHLKIGRLLLEETAQKNQSESIFDVVDQINRGVDLVTDVNEKKKIAKLNLMAGIRSKTSIAYQTAFVYLKTGISLLEADCWETQYDLALALYTEATEAASLTAQSDEMNVYSEIIIKNAKNILDKIRVYETQMIYLSGIRKFQEALDIGLYVLKLLGITFPKNPSTLDVIFALMRTKFLLMGKTTDDLYNLPPMTNPYYEAAMVILLRCGVSHFIDPNLFVLTNLKGISLSMKYGNSNRSALNYAGYSLILCTVFNELEKGYQFGQLALRLLDRYPDNNIKTTVMLITSMISYWHDPIDKSIALHAGAIQSGRERGEVEGAQLSAYLSSNLILYSGKNLNAVVKEIEKNIAISNSMSIGQKIFSYASEYMAVNLQTAFNLMGFSKEATTLSGEACDESVLLPKFEQEEDDIGNYFIHQNKLVLFYLFQDYQKAYEQGYKTSLVTVQINYIGGPAFFLFYSLSCLACYSLATTKKERKKLLKCVIANQKKLKLWAVHSPANILSKYYLVEAELAHVLKETEKAMDYFDRAIKQANENGFVHEEALANEIAARFYLDIGKEKIAKVYINDAHYCYLKWGAVAKAQNLNELYPQLLASPQMPVATGTSLSSTSQTVTQRLDLAAVMKAAHAISSEIEFSDLLTKLMHIVIENAGAQKGFLLFDKAGKWTIEAEATVDKTEMTTVLQSIPIEGILPVTLINHVIQNKMPLSLEDATQSEAFVSDPYIQSVKPKSVLCMPFINQGTVNSILYMENNLAAGVFTQDRLELLNLLSGHIITAIDNARLYSNLKALNQMNESFVPREFLNLLEKDSVMDLKLGDQIQKEMTIMFCDIRGFTPMSEKMTPQETMAFINEYLSKMVPIITQYKGVIDKYMGDAIMVLYPASADDALLSAIAMLNKLQEYNAERKNADQNLMDIHIGIGLNTGLLVLGTVGDPKRMDGTVISDAVNVASQMEELTKSYSASILITKKTYDRLENPDKFAIRKLATLYIKRKSTPETIYEVFDNDTAASQALKKKTLQVFEQGVELFEKRKYKKALAAFQEVVKINPADLAAIACIKRCEKKIPANRHLHNNIIPHNQNTIG